MKKPLAIFIAVMLCVALIACGGQSPSGGNHSTPGSGTSGASEQSGTQTADIENKIGLSLDKNAYGKEERIEVTLDFEKLNQDSAVIVIVRSDMEHGKETPAHDDYAEYRYLSDFSELPFYLWAPNQDGLFDVRVYADGDGGAELASAAIAVGDAAPNTVQHSGDQPGGAGSKDFAFPQREFVADWAVYAGGGTFVFTNPGGQLDEKTAAMTYIDGATVADVQAYINTLKDNGLTPDESFHDEDVDQYGSLIWFGANADKSLCVSVSYYEAGDEIEDLLYNTGTHGYNLLIQVSNYDFMNAF